MLAGRLFLFFNGLLGLLLGGFVTLFADLSILGIQLTGAPLIEVRTAMGGAWLTLGLYWFAATFGRRVRTAVGAVSGFYAVTAIARGIAMQAGGSTEATLMFLAFEAVVALLGALLFFVTLAPNRRRIFAGAD